MVRIVQKRAELETIAGVAQLLGVVLVVATLYFARDVFIPLALSLLLSFLLSPIVYRLQRLGVSNSLAVVVTASGAFLMLAIALLALGSEISALVSQLPNYKDELVTKARTFGGLTSNVGGSFDQLAEEVTEAMEEGEETSKELIDSEEKVNGVDGVISRNWLGRYLPIVAENDVSEVHNGQTPKTPLYITTVDREMPLATWAATAGTLLGPLTTAGMVSVFALFMLLNRENLRDRIIAAISHGNYVTTTEALDEVAVRISRYLVAQTFINASHGIVLAVGLSLIGWFLTDKGYFPNAVLWGVIAICLRFVPYIGPIASAVFPLMIAFSVFPGYHAVIAVLILIVVLELVSNNLVEPWLYGSSTGISTVAIIIAAVFWGWLWGPVGLLLSTPLTVCLVVLGRHVPRFKVFALLLGEDVQIRPALKLYQRLLANDRHRAHEMLVEGVEQDPADEVVDDLIIPALKRIRSDYQDDKLREQTYTEIISLLAETAEQIDWKRRVTTAKAREFEFEDRVPLVATIAHHSTELIPLNILENAWRDRWETLMWEEANIDAEQERVWGGSVNIDGESLGRWIAEKNPLVALVVVLPPGGSTPARYLTRAIRDAGYRGTLLVACLGRFRYAERLAVRYRKSGATSMVTTMKQAALKIDSTLSRYDRLSKLAHPQSAVQPMTHVETN